MKIKRIEVKNFKAIDSQTVAFDGCSVIVTGGNDMGKSSLLKGLIDRFQSEIPGIIVKKGESNGFYNMELTDGSVIEWKFTEKSESFSFTSKDGIETKTGVLKQLSKKYFGIRFDIDKFLTKSSTEQAKDLQKLLGLDLTEIEARYNNAREKRKQANSVLETLRAQNVKPLTVVEKPSIEILKAKKVELQKEANENIAEITNENEKRKKAWQNENYRIEKEVVVFNDAQLKKTDNIENAKNSLIDILTILDKNSIIKTCFNEQKAYDVISKMPEPEPLKTFVPTNEPEYTSTIIDYSKVEKIDTDIEVAYVQLSNYNNYIRLEKEYDIWIQQGIGAAENAKQLNELVKSIELEKKEMINSAKMPVEFEFSDNGLLYKGFPLNSKQISSSGRYTAALKLGYLGIGELETMHFDASFLDNKSLAKIMEWSDSVGLQLNVERPDLDAGEIRYNIIQEK